MTVRQLIRRSVVAVAVVVALVSAGCKKGEGGGGTAATRPAVQLGVIAKSTTAAYWTAVHDGAARAAADGHVDMIWTGPDAETSHAQQAAMVDNMVNRGVAGIVLAPTNVDALVRPVESAVRRGIPVVLMDSTLNSKAPAAVVATDNEAAGRQAADALVAALGADRKFGGTVLMLRFLEGSGSTGARERGFAAGIKAAGLTLAGDAYTKGSGSSTDAAETADALLRRFTTDNVLRVDGVFAANEPAAIGMLRKLQQVKAQGVTVTARFVAFDAADPLLAGLRAGDVAAIVTQDPRRIGALAVETMAKVLRGEHVPAFVPTPTATVTKANVDSAEIKAILGG